MVSLPTIILYGEDRKPHSSNSSKKINFQKQKIRLCRLSHNLKITREQGLSTRMWKVFKYYYNKKNNKFRWQILTNFIPNTLIWDRYTMRGILFYVIHTRNYLYLNTLLANTCNLLAKAHVFLNSINTLQMESYRQEYNIYRKNSFGFSNTTAAKII